MENLMRRISNISLKRRLFIVTIALSIVSILTGGIAFLEMSSINGAAQNIYQNGTLPISYLATARSNFLTSQGDLTLLAETTSPSVQSALKAEIASTYKKFESGVASYQSNLQSFETSKKVVADKIAAEIKVLDSNMTKAISLAGSSSFGSYYNSNILSIRNSVISGLGNLMSQERSNAALLAVGANNTQNQAFLIVLAVLIVGLSFGLTFALLTAKSITKPMAAIMNLIDGLRANDLTRRSNLESKDEMGQMGDALDKAVAEIAATMLAINDAADTLAAAVTELTATADQVGDNAQDASDKATLVSASVEEIASILSTLSSGATQMTASIAEISRSASFATEITEGASALAGSARKTIDDLDAASERIGGVVELIASIAEQTNLLALNATIESARAGEAGRGFAVVADEVKDLAVETAKATKGISTQIDEIRQETRSAVEIISKITEVISEVNKLQMTVSAAVEEQSATTTEITHSVEEVAVGSNEIAANVSNVASASRSTTEAMEASKIASNDLARLANNLAGMVGKFRLPGGDSSRPSRSVDAAERFGYKGEDNSITDRTKAR
ncbi:MAG: methyl-accepting chemotaxis protein [Actinomycetota bacterium]|nr:methyl-accepting chemotaxis protein [Actinomycetota bacterium]